MIRNLENAGTNPTYAHSVTDGQSSPSSRTRVQGVALATRTVLEYKYNGILVLQCFMGRERHVTDAMPKNSTWYLVPGTTWYNTACWVHGVQNSSNTVMLSLMVQGTTTLLVLQHNYSSLIARHCKTIFHRSSSCSRIIIKPQCPRKKNQVIQCLKKP